MPEKVKRRYRKSNSEGPVAVALDVIGKLERGEKVKMRPIMLAHGYSPVTATVPANVTKTQGYIDTMKTYTEKLTKERDRVIDAMAKKDLTEEQYRTLSDAQTKLTHDVQLLSGEKTENVGLENDRNTLRDIVKAIQMGSEKDTPTFEVLGTTNQYGNKDIQEE